MVTTHKNRPGAAITVVSHGPGRQRGPMRMRRALSSVIVAVALLLAPNLMGDWTAAAEADKPIISLLFGDSEAYDGRSVVIYGLVIETVGMGKVFKLQDVSQMPLRIIRADGLPTMVGDEMLVHGVFVRNGGDPYLEASRITATTVLGGGGCC